MAFLVIFGMYYIYILFSETSDKYYVGHTDNVQRRINEHNHSDMPTYTSKHRPWCLCAVFECGTDRKEALNTERFIKRQKSRRLIHQMIAGERLEGRLAQLVRVPHVRD